MKTYIVVIQDKVYHSIIDVSPFSKFDDAINYCREEIAKYNEQILDEYNFGTYTIITNEYKYEIHSCYIKS